MWENGFGGMAAMACHKGEPLPKRVVNQRVKRVFAG